VSVRSLGLLAGESGLDRLLAPVSFVLLAVPFAPYVLIQQPTAGDLGRTFAVAAPTALWLILFLVVLPARYRERQLVMSVYLTGLVAASAVLIARSPWFAFFCWIGYVQGNRYLTGVRRHAATVATAALVAVSQVGGYHHPSAAGVLIVAVITVVNATLVMMFVAIGRRAEAQSEQRKRMMVQLAESNRRLEETMAENAGLHAQLLSQAREAGVLEERQRMAREIHDTLAQGLTGIITQLEAVRQSGPAGPGWERRVDNAANLARDSLTEARRSVQALRPEALADARLPEALGAVAAQWAAVNTVPATVTTDGEPVALHPEIEVTLLRVAQEALANTAKYAAAGRVGITLSYMADVVTLDVRDDGVGFRPAAVAGRAPGGEPAPRDSVPAPGPGDGRSGGFGLTAMRQRVQRVAGTLAIESEPGTGTAVSASVPAIPRAAGQRRETAQDGTGEHSAADEHCEHSEHSEGDQASDE
jgi:signal transduction histidine kinase